MLIDTEVFLNSISKLEETGMEQISLHDLRDLVKNQPVAYDIEAVIMGIKKKARKMSTANVPHTYYRAVGTKICESIVREGGII